MNKIEPTHPPHVLLPSRVLSNDRRAKGGFSTSAAASGGVGKQRTSFNKPAFTVMQTVQKLQRQGLIIDEATMPSALNYIRYVGAYRLKKYWRHLLDPRKNKFPPGYSFGRLADRYEFDRQLRALTIEAIERLEIAVRSVIVNYLSVKHSPHWFSNAALFKAGGRYKVSDLVMMIESAVKREKEQSNMIRYYSRYSRPPLPPSWMVGEYLTFGLWSRVFQMLIDQTDRKAISNRFGIDQPAVFESWIHTLTVTRNTAAHNGQFLRGEMRVAPCGFKRVGILFNDPQSFFAVATVINYMLMHTELPSNWTHQLRTLFAKYPAIEIKEIGFPKNWADQAGWLGSTRPKMTHRVD